MNKRLLGKTGLSVSEIAFGCVEIGMPYGIGVNSREDMLSEDAAVRLLNNALDSGIDFFDTARIYGNSEEIIGKAFKERRNEVILCTKCRHLRDSHGELPKDLEIDNIIESSFYESLERLQTDYVDIFMLHQVDKDILENDYVSDTFLRLKKEGKVRTTGISTYTVEETEGAIELGIWDVIQLPFNLMDQRQMSLFTKASEKGIGIVVRSVLLKGLLSDRGKSLHPALEKVEKHITNYNELLEKTNYNLPTLATKFALSFPEVSAVLVGIDKKEYLDQALETANGVYLDGGKLEKARRLAYPDPEFLNLPYWDKMNWLR